MVGEEERKKETVCILLSLPYICLKSNFMGQIFLENFSMAVRYRYSLWKHRLSVWELSEEELEKICSQRDLLCSFAVRENVTKCSSLTYKVFQPVSVLSFSQQCYDRNQSNFLAFAPGGAK